MPSPPRPHLRRWIMLACGTIVCGVAAGLFLRNNPEVLSPHSPVSLVSGDSPSHPDTAEPADSAEGTPVPQSSIPGELGASSWVELADLTCQPSDQPGVKVLVSLRVGVSGPEAEHEVLFKREELRVLALKALQGLTAKELTVENVRSRIFKRFAGITSPAAVADIAVDRIRLDRK